MKAFTISMVRAAIGMTNGAVPTDVIRQLVDLGTAMLVEPVHLLPHVPEVLDRVGGHAVHVPYHVTWDLELVDDHDEDVVELASLADLPDWLGL